MGSEKFVGVYSYSLATFLLISMPGFSGNKTNSAQTEAGAKAELGKNDHEVVYYMVAPVPDQSVARPNRACLTGLLITNLHFNLYTSTLTLKPLICNLLPATCNLQLAICNLQPATYNIQLATCNLQHAMCNLQSVAYNLQTSTCNLQTLACKLLP